MPAIVQFLISEKTVITIIIINALVMFLDGFETISKATNGLLIWIDYACVIFFIIEAILKMIYLESDEYWENTWNKFDFWVVIASTPTLLEPFIDVKIFSVILILRLGRLARFFKLLRFVPDGPRILLGVKRALKASIAIFLVLFILNIILGMGGTILFSNISPTHFGNPLLSCYTMFKVFTIEGWHSIPDEIIANSSGMSTLMSIFIRIYFIVAVITGGILGLSIANAVFVDEMTLDNTNELEKQVHDLKNQFLKFESDTKNSLNKIVSQLIATQNENIKNLLTNELQKIHNELNNIKQSLNK